MQGAAMECGGDDRLVDAPLVVESFGRRYRRGMPWAVRDVSFALQPGSITALVGPNGAGKSTLIRACVGFERPDEGRVLVSNLDPTKHRAAAVRTVGYVPQAAALYRALTIGDHLDMAAQARKAFDRHYARRHLAAANLGEHRAIGELSGGEQAQVSLALALGTRAAVLLLDEPMASLDPLARRDFLTRLSEDVHERGSCALLSSHIVTDIEQACDRLVVLADGRLELDAHVTEAKTKFRTIGPTDIQIENGDDNGVPIGAFSGPSGESLRVVAGGDDGRPASLEEIVLAHLARARSSRTRAAA